MVMKWFRGNKVKFLLISGMLVCLVIGWLLYLSLGHLFIKTMYDSNSIGFLNSIIDGQQTNPVENYFEIADRIVLRFSAALLSLLLIALYLLLAKKFKSGIINPMIFFIIIYAYIFLYTYNMNMRIYPVSTIYISTAEHLLEGKGFYSKALDQAAQDEFIRTGIRKRPEYSQESQPYTHWPPLYPLLLALSMRILSVNPATAALIINRIFFGISITLIYLILAQSAPQRLRPIAALIAIGLTFFMPLNDVFGFVWTEITYICLSIFAIYLLHKFFSSDQEKELIFQCYSNPIRFISLDTKYEQRTTSDENACPAVKAKSAENT